MRRMYSVEQLKALVASMASKGELDFSNVDLAVQSLSVSGSINGEKNPSVKPIYCHPLNIGGNVGIDQFAITCLIFTNDPTPFTWTTFNEWLSALANEIETARVATTGYIYINNDSTFYPANWLFVDKSTLARRRFICRPQSMGTAIQIDVADYEAFTPTLFNDGVNIIN